MIFMIEFIQTWQAIASFEEESPSCNKTKIPSNGWLGQPKGKVQQKENYHILYGKGETVE